MARRRRRAGSPGRDIVAEFERYFGNETNLDNWLRLCHDVGVQEEPNTITQCRKALKGVWVNIYDLLDAIGRDELPYQFPSQRALSKYTLDTRKIYPRKRAFGPVKALLAHIF